ncbi:uncharacterized protein METZ01_LOCUS200052 [marine metagenome]|uniref:Uncharacterized protein n=1 Tax=marine metagenome TaxID=408172 RepID=A0A382E926_9ZZZZ
MFFCASPSKVLSLQNYSHLINHKPAGPPSNKHKDPPVRFTQGAGPGMY